MYLIGTPKYSRLLQVAMLVLGCACAVSGMEEKHHHSRLSEYTDVLCPYNVICRDGEPRREPPVQSDIAGCCTDCSCSDECGLTENCCFPILDKYRLVDRSRQECIYTSTSENPDIGDFPALSYHMVVDSFPSGSGDDCGDEYTPCGRDEDATALGSLYPVFSKKTGRIYKNIKCAKCHGLGEVDVVQWRAYLLCDGLPRVDASTIFQFFSNNQTMDPFCHIRFFYPGQMSDLSRERCYPETTKTCVLDNNFFITEGLNMTREEIRYACISSFTSPVLYGKWFKNVFCAICNVDTISGFKYNPLNICNSQESKPVFTFEKAFSSFSFGALIRPDDLKQLYVPISQNKYNQPTACKVSKNNITDCRLIHCPSGQIRQTNGQCIYPAQYWNMESISIYIKLFPKQDINVSALSNINFDRMIANMSMYMAPWSTLWQVASLMYINKTRLDNHGNIVDYFLAHMVYGKTRINLTKFVQTVKKSINEALVLYFDDFPVAHRQEFSELTGFYYYTTSFAVPVTEVLGDPPLSMTQNLTVPTFRVLFVNLSFVNEATITLTKMFFCEQILLQPAEYEYNNDIRLLRLTSTGRVFFSGEIATAYDASLGYVPKLCLDDSGFTRQSLQSLQSSGTDGSKKKYILSFACFVCIYSTGFK